MTRLSHALISRGHDGSDTRETLLFPLSSFWRAVWLCPIVFAIHALEDAPLLADWMNSVPVFEHVTQRQLLIALVFLVGLASLATSTAAATKKSRIGLYWFLWMQGFLFLHGIAHLLPSLWVLGYTPGFWTALLLNIPVAVYLLWRSRKEGLVSRRALVIVCVLAVLLYDPVLRMAFQIGAEKILQNNPPASPEWVPVRILNPLHPVSPGFGRQARTVNMAELMGEELQ